MSLLGTVIQIGSWQRISIWVMPRHITSIKVLVINNNKSIGIFKKHVFTSVRAVLENFREFPIFANFGLFKNKLLMTHDKENLYLSSLFFEKMLLFTEIKL